MRILLQILSIGFITFYGSIGHAGQDSEVHRRTIAEEAAHLRACLAELKDQQARSLEDLRNRQALYRMTPQKRYARVAKIHYHILFAEMNVNGKSESVMIRPDDIEDMTGKTWAANNIREGAYVLVDWTPQNSTTRAVQVPVDGSAPAEILSVKGEDIKLKILGKDIELLGHMSQVVGRGSASVVLEKGSLAWVKWNTADQSVISIDPKLQEVRNLPSANDARPRKGLAEIKKLSHSYLHAQMLSDSERRNFVITSGEIKNRVGSTWGENNIQVGSIVLVDWVSGSFSKKTVHLPREGSAPVEIVGLQGDTVTMRTLTIGNSYEIVGKSSQIVNSGEALSNLGLTLGSIVWAEWNPQDHSVESIVP